MTVRIPLAAFAALMVSIAPAAAEWALLADKSRIGFLSVKAGEIAESHYFRDMEGSVSASGAAEIRIPLDSVETNIDIRNERMREFLFETDKHPQAVIAAAIDLDALDDLKTGERRPVEFTGELTLHGFAEPIDATLIVTRISKTRVLVETTDPVILFTDFFEFGAGIEKLRELASLPSITPSAPVAVSLVFERRD